MRMGLSPSQTPAPLFLGQGVHTALDVYYSLPEEDRTVEVLQQAFHDWVKERSQKMKELTGPLWSAEKEMIREMYDLGMAMLLHYWLWVQPYDEYLEIIDTESKFTLPVPRPDPFRGPSRNINLAGRFDGIVRDRRNGKYFILEFKTTARSSSMKNYYRNLQGTAYTWAARQIYGLDVEGVLYRGLVKKVPANPKPLKRGGFSRAKSQKSTPHWFKYCFEQIAEGSEDYAALLQENARILSILEGKIEDFFIRKAIHKTDQQLENAMQVIYHIGSQMNDPYIPIFAQPGWHCNWCPFADPCALKDIGGDWEGLLEIEYGHRTYWDDEPGGDDNED
jgi:hypothetical protein